MGKAEGALMELNLTFNQKVAIILVALGVLTTGGTAADLATLIGPGYAKLVTAAANMAQTFLAGFLAVVTGQGSLIKDVRSMPGVEKITVNAQANPTLAAIAMDPNEHKIEPTLEDADAVEATSKE